MQRNIKENTCRVCLTEQKVLISLFDEVEEFQLKLCELLENCGDIKVDFEDIYSKFICGECTHELLVAAKFREKCKNTKEILSQFVPAEEFESNASIEDVIPDPPSPVTHELCKIEESVELQIKAEIEDDELDNDQFPTTDCCEMQSKVSCIEEIVPTDMFEQVEFLETAESAAQFIILGNEIPREGESEINTENLINIAQEANDECHDEEHPPLRKKKAVTSRITKPVVINYNCEVCGAGFNKVKNLRRHLNTHSTWELYTCPLCSYPFVDIEAYQLHQNDHEKCVAIANVKDIEEITDTTEQPPDNVKKKPDFEQIPFLKSNSAVEAAVKRSHLCQYCEKGFVSKSSLAAHLRIHTGDRPFHCTLCSKKFTTQGGLVLHTRRHTGLRPFVCNICNKRFVESSNLKVHMRIHTGEKPHKCTICGRSFARVFLLQLHQRTHTGERPYSCPFCNKAFAQQGDLASHKRIHTGERPHACQFCGKGFIKSSALTQHLKKHTKVDAVRFNCPNIKEEDFSVLIIEDENLRSCDNEEDSRDIDEPMDVIVKSPGEEVTSC